MKKTAISILVPSLAVMLFCLTVQQPAYAAVECGFFPDSICQYSDEAGDVQNSSTWKIILWAINILSGVVGLLAVAAVAWASFIYTTAADDAAKTKQAKTIIANVVVSLVLYIFMYAILQYLIPGGIFSR